MAIPVKEFRVALKALNGVLGKKDAIKTLKRKKEDIIVDFRDAVLKAIENDTAEALPVVVIDMYNDHMSDDDGDEEGGTGSSDKDTKKKEAAAKKKEAAAKKKEAAAKKKEAAAKKKEAAAKKTTKVPGICVSAIKAYMEDGVTKDAKSIVEHIEDDFPDRDISKTVSHVFGVLRHIKPYSK